MTVEKVAARIPPHTLANGSVAVREDVSPVISARCLGRFPDPALRAKQDVAAAIESNAVDVAVANAVDGVHVRISGRGRGPGESVVGGTVNAILLCAQPKISADGIHRERVNAGAHVRGVRNA